MGGRHRRLATGNVVSLVLEGTLEDVGLVELLRLVARECRSGELRVTVDDRTWRLALASGRVVGGLLEDAAAGTAEPLDPARAIGTLVRHRRGAFRLAPDPGANGAGATDADGAAGEGEGAESLARRGEMALLDLSERLAAVGGELCEPRRDRFPTPKQMESLGPAERAVYGLVNGERDLGEILVRTRLDPAVALDALDVLVGLSLVAVPGPRDIDAVVEDGRAAARSGSDWRDWLASALPLVVLLGLVGLVHRAPTEPAPDPFAIERAPLAEAHAVFAKRRVRTALDAFRAAEGHWPARLEELAERGYLPGSALAAAHGRAYYYAHRDGRIVLLAPER